MAKKVKESLENQDVEIVQPDTEKTSKKEKTDNKVKTVDKKNTKKKAEPKKAGLGKKIKESISELKKVNWPTFGKVCKQTGMVITVVLVCTLILFGMDRLLSWIFTLLAY